MNSKEDTAYEPQLEEKIYVSYSLRNGKSWDYTITYTNSDYHSCESYEEANIAMKTDAGEKVNEIRTVIQENLGKETGYIQLGNCYIANRDLAMINLRAASFTYNRIPW